MFGPFRMSRKACTNVIEEMHFSFPQWLGNCPNVEVLHCNTHKPQLWRFDDWPRSEV